MAKQLDKLAEFFVCTKNNKNDQNNFDQVFICIKDDTTGPDPPGKVYYRWSELPLKSFDLPKGWKSTNENQPMKINQLKSTNENQQMKINQWQSNNENQGTKKENI